MKNAALIFILLALQIQVFSQNAPLSEKEFILRHYENKLNTENSNNLKAHSVFSLFNRIYRLFLSEQLSANCEFEPSCSVFSGMAISEFGNVKGLFLTTDRLTRCNGSAKFEAPAFLLNPGTAKVKDYPFQYRFNNQPFIISIPADSLGPEIIGLIKKHKAPEQKSALKAGLLSALVPGLGKAYLGSKGQALSAFVMNAGIAAVATELLIKVNDPTLTLAGFGMLTAFYGGNIWGTVAYAKKRQIDYYRQTEHDIREFYHRKNNNKQISQLLLKTPFTSIESHKFAFELFLKEEYEKSYSVQTAIPDSIRLTNIQDLRLWLLTQTELQKFTECKDLLLRLTDSTSILHKEIASLSVSPKFRSPSKAMRLSTFLPGLGQAYSGYPLKGLSSLLLEAGCGVLSVLSYSQGLFFTGTVFGVYPFYRFYQGGRRMSWFLAEKTNQQNENKLKNIYQNLILTLY